MTAWCTVFEAGLLLALLHFSIKHRLTYWKRHGMCSVKGKYLLGNMKKFWKRHISEAIQESYEKLKHKDIVGGFYLFLRPILLVFHPETIGHILGKDAEHFSVQRPTRDLNVPVSTLNEGHRWKALRTEISSSVRASQSQKMFETLLEVGTEFGQFVEQEADAQKPLEVSDLCSRFAVDVLANCGFGVTANSFKEPSNKFRKMTKAAMAQNSGILQRLKLFLVETFPEPISQCLRAHATCSKRRDNEEYFAGIVRERVELFRKKGNNSKESNFLNTLLEISLSEKAMTGGDSVEKKGYVIDKKKVRERGNSGKLNEGEIVTEMMTFFTEHGLQAIQSTMSWCIYELARNSAVQDKLVDEVNTVLLGHKNFVSWAAIEEMPFLEQVIQETLRLHPSVHSVRRFTTSNYPIPDSTHIITRGTCLLVPVLAIHRDSMFYPRPEEFNPNRFTEAEMDKRPPNTFLPVVGGFGGDTLLSGTALEFAKWQIKTGLVLLLQKFRFTLNDKKTKKTIKAEPKSQIRTPKQKIWIDLRKQQ